MRARGFTLIELLVAMTVSLLTVAAGVTLLVASQRWFEVGKDDRAMQETARVALDELTTSLRTAGYGMEPAHAFDMGVLASTIQDRLPPGAVAPRFGGYNCPTGACPTLRDKVDAPDEVVFYARDPAFERDVPAVGANSLTLAGATAPGLQPGQILQVMCYGASDQWLWAYVTVATSDESNPAAVKVTLEPSGAQPNDFPLQNGLLTQPCYGAGAAFVRAFKIDRFRYYVAAVDERDGSVKGWEAPGTRPYLMLDRGLSDANGNPLVTAVVPDVEDLQVAYVYPLAQNGQLLGGDPAAGQVTADVAGEDAGVFNLQPARPFVIPSFSTPSIDVDVALTSHHPANIRAVRVAIVVRTPRTDLGVSDATVPAALNRPDVPGEAGYRRMLFESTAYTRNLETALPVFPQYDPNYTGATTCCPPGGTCDGNCGGA